ncbi:helix-turn-helix domain-containing protein [Bradyrhizobium diazoefficiens]|uniref:MmyB family transcriptional regulator n=1 Tax=Bradyrhizobium diazoefficiens TaxID=1355477 RepID=UPI002B476FAC|nr:helix-turn-helix domain-containing protein [Bradyrhizobium diazoefficiens]WRJ01257.1 helix-turn-helix domain-containing protein [Bradyrhizobium diazoefficiens]
MTAHQLPFGILLRRWRERRRLTQTDLALAANSSTRHLSCLETGKAQPSRAIINRLTDLLDVPLRDRNRLLLAAGFAPAYEETSIDGLEAARAAMDRILQAHKPYPAFAVDRRWNVVLSNGALPQLYEGCSEALLEPPINAMRLMLHPAGMGPRILNLAAWRAYCLSVLRQQIEAGADPWLQNSARRGRSVSRPVRLDHQHGLRAVRAASHPAAYHDAPRHHVLFEYRDRLRHRH